MTFRITCLNNDTVGMSKGMWGEHGVSYLIERGAERILFDTGTSWEIVQHNLKELEINLDGVTHLVLSHGHYDHTGGLMGALNEIDHPTLVADPLIFNKKYARNPKTGETHGIGIPYTHAQVAQNAKLLLTEDMFQILPGISVTGRIPHITTFEHTPDHMFVDVQGELEPDTLPDDRSMILDSGKGLIVLCGCCHAGLINTLAYVRDRFERPVSAIIGGIHLVGAKPERIQMTIESLQSEFEPEEMYFNHCTGLEATVALINAFGEKVKPCLAGTVLEFDEVNDE